MHGVGMGRQMSQIEHVDLFTQCVDNAIFCVMIKTFVAVVSVRIMQQMKETGTERLGKLIKKIREESGLDLRKFAELCVKEDGFPISFSTLNKIEKGASTPTSDVLRAIARNPYVSEDYNLAALYELLEGADNPLAQRTIHTAHQIIPYASKIADDQKKELIIKLIPLLSRDSKMEILQSILDSFTQPAKVRKKD